MLDSANLVAFAATTDAERTKAFYGRVLGLAARFRRRFRPRLRHERQHAPHSARVEKAVPPPYTSLGRHVADIAAAVKDLTARGVTFERYDGMGQDELGIWRHGHGGVAWFKDPEGALLSISGD